MTQTLREREYRGLHRSGCLDVFDSNVPRFFETRERPDFARFLDELPGPFIVFENAEGEVVACGGVAVEEDGSGSLCWGMVRRDLHGRGLGRRLLARRVEILESLTRTRRIRLETIPSTVGFFEKMGFRVRRREPDGHAPGSELVELERELTQ